MWLVATVQAPHNNYTLIIMLIDELRKKLLCNLWIIIIKNTGDVNVFFSNN